MLPSLFWTDMLERAVMAQHMLQLRVRGRALHRMMTSAAALQRRGRTPSACATHLVDVDRQAACE